MTSSVVKNAQISSRNIACCSLLTIASSMVRVSIMDESQVAYEILAYLSKNPDAQDTIDGIVEWWLLAQHIERHVAKVKSALADLVDRGLILERTSTDSRVYYCLNRRREKEIAEILARVSATQTGRL